MISCDQCEENFPEVESVSLFVGSMTVLVGGDETRFSNENLVFCSVECALARLEEMLDKSQWL